MKGKSQRRLTDRVSLTMPIRVSGTDVAGKDFDDVGRTLSICRDGATIVLGRRLAPVQLVAIHNLSANKKAKARIVGQIGGQPSGYVYGVALLPPVENIWNIQFPPLPESDEPVGRVVLECTVCQTREVAYLSELEVEVFEANRSLSRTCKPCSGWTAWKQVADETHPDPGQTPALHDSATPAASRSHQGKNKRTQVRVPLKQMTACIRQPGFGEEVVRVDNVSRGGLRFLSANTYYEGSRIEVAVPYAKGGANIFVPARIVRSQELPDAGLREYGAAYTKPQET